MYDQSVKEVPEKATRVMADDKEGKRTSFHKKPRTEFATLYFAKNKNIFHFNYVLS